MKLSDQVSRLDSSDDQEVARYDRASFASKTSRTPQGFLKVPAFFTRVGIFKYRQPDGTTIRELRSAEEVFHVDSLATLYSAPATVDHPKPLGTMVSSTNAKALAVGWAGDTVTRQDNLVSGHVTVMDKDVIDKVLSGRIKEISMGYKCLTDKTPGVHPEFGEYDQSQKNIRYNHVALGAKSWGRAGSECSLRLDSGDATQIDTWEEKLKPDPKPEPRADAKKAERLKMETIIIGGVEFEVPKACAQAHRLDSKNSVDAIETLKSDQEKLQGRFDAQEEKLKKSEKALEEAVDSERFDSAVATRIALVGKAQAVLGEDEKVAGNAREIMESVLRHDNKDLDLSKKSEDYIEARFDACVESFEAKHAQDNKDNKDVARFDAFYAGAGAGVKMSASEKSRQEMIKRNAETWKPKVKGGA